MAGLDPAIPLGRALCHPKRDHRVTALRAGPVMTALLRGTVSDRKDDPAFIYFPTNYRWSMGLLLCLSAAPWGGAEIDEVNRVGRALRDKLGDDQAWFEEWARMGDTV